MKPQKKRGMKHIHSKVSEELKAEVARDTPEKWVITDEKLHLYKKEFENTEDYQPNIMELRICEVCEMVFTRKKWPSHKWFELHGRKGTRKLTTINKLYNCPLPPCKFTPTPYHHTITNQIGRAHV